MGEWSLAVEHRLRSCVLNPQHPKINKHIKIGTNWNCSKEMKHFHSSYTLLGKIVLNAGKQEGFKIRLKFGDYRRERAGRKYNVGRMVLQLNKLPENLA